MRTLRDDGIRLFRSWLQDGAHGEAPRSLLTSESASEPLPGAGEVEIGDFASRYEMGRHVFDALGHCDFQRISYEPGVWAWLALYYIDLLCPTDRHGRRTVLELARYLLLPEYRNYYRHLVREPVMLIRRHGEVAQVLLTSRAGRFRISRVFEEIASRQELISNTGVVELVWRLYFNAKRRTVRPGVASPDRPGGIRRLALVLQQLGLNYDLPDMSAEQIGNLLPREFDVWRRRANWTPIAPAGATRVRFDLIKAGSEWSRGQLAETWGYRGVEGLKTSLLAPRGSDALVLFVSPTDRWEVDRASDGSSDGRTFTWEGDARHSVDRRLIIAAREERTVHIFRRPERQSRMVYLGPGRILSCIPRSDAPSEFVFRLPVGNG